VSRSAAQGPAGSFVVKTRFTNPIAISLGLGEYVEVKFALLGENVPVPPDHDIEVAEPPILPCNITDVFAQTIWSTPALAIAGVNTFKYPLTELFVVITPSVTDKLTLYVPGSVKLRAEDEPEIVLEKLFGPSIVHV
jgi:hypothetical protein